MKRNITLNELISALEQKRDLGSKEVLSLGADSQGNLVVRLNDDEIRFPQIVDRSKPEVFCTGGGIWLSAMWIDENRYAVTDNDCAMGGFCIYDHREEDQDDEFPCQNMVGEKYLNETEEPYKMTDEERYIYFRLHDALLREAGSIDLNGKWCADIIHTDGADTFPQFAYRGTFYFESGAEATAYGVDWSSFCTDVRLKTGIRLPLRKNMQFFKLSDFEQIAGIDAAHERPNGFHVTKRERFGEGWRAHEAICR